MTFTEQALQFDCAGQRLLGIASVPTEPHRVGVLIVVGGPQYRVGSHRQFVLLARHLAAHGVPVLRFDYRGMGDSPGELGHFERVTPDITAAIGALKAAVPLVQHVVLWGLCDGASAALLHAQETSDARVAGLVLLNPWVRTAASQARTRVQHYYWQRLRDKQFWAKLFSGKVAGGALRDFVTSLRAALQRGRQPPAAANAAALPYPERMALGWQGFAGPISLMLSERDYTAREFESYCSNAPAWQRAFRSKPAATVALSQSDHTCSQPEAEKQLHQKTLAFVLALVNRDCAV